MTIEENAAISLNEEWEQDRYAVSVGMEAFYEAGKALQRIKKNQSYETAGYKTFAEAIKAEWGMTVRNANRLIKSADTCGNLLTGEKGTVVPNSPTSERQVRPINDLTDDPELQQEIWNAAVETAPDGEVTEAHVKDVRDIVIVDETKVKGQKVNGREYVKGHTERTTLVDEMKGMEPDEKREFLKKRLEEHRQQERNKTPEQRRQEEEAERKAYREFMSQLLSGGGGLQFSDPDEQKLFNEAFSIGYRKLADKYHPDKGGDAEMMQKLNNVKATVLKRTAVQHS